MWDVATRRRRHSLRLTPRATAFAQNIVPHVDNEHFFCGGELFEIASGKVVYRFPEHETDVVAVLPDGDRVLVRGNGTPLQAWSLARGAIATLDRRFGPVAWLGPTRLITAWYELGVWDVASWTRVATISTGHRGEVVGLAAFPELGLAVTGSGDHDVALWDVEAGRRLATFTAEASIRCCAAVPGTAPTIVAGDRLGNVHFLRIEGR